MNILSMLARLEHALGRPALAKQMVLLPQARSVKSPSSAQEINLVVGYNGSPRSQTALDLTLWIAHQTRLATGKQVTVQVVYVSNLEVACGQVRPFVRQNAGKSGKAKGDRTLELRAQANTRAAKRAIAALEPTAQSCQLAQFEQADHILWQARHLADEWRGSLKTHLRFGVVAEELRQVVEAESASLLLLGCESADNPVVQALSQPFPCPVLGIPIAL